MFSTLRNRFGIPGVISVIALVFAMLGGAYAAQSNSGGKATASAKAKKGPRGPKGPAGPAGPQGPAGPLGAKGDAGAAGANGQNGAPGANGKDGASTEATSFSGAKGGCTEGGVEVKSAKPTTFVCNGKKGENGQNGQTGFTETLPPGKTETGTFAGSIYNAEEGNELAIPISFPIPLAEGGGEAHVFNKEETDNEEFGSSGCTGSVEEPTAPPGVFCAYTAEEAKQNFFYGFAVFAGAGFQKSGTVIRGLELEEPAKLQVNGSWAVTAPEL